MQKRKGIILAGGSGSRLYPITIVTNKQLLPIYNKPMIYYPLATLMLAGIREILIISTPYQINLFKTLFSTSERLGISLSFAEQDKPNGIAEALIIADDFLNCSPCALILGDNFFYGSGLKKQLCELNFTIDKSCIFSKAVPDPSAYGVVHLDKFGRPLSIIEKPQEPKSNLAVTGLYFYDGTASEKARRLKPSKRNELEITDLNNIYLKEGKLDVVNFSDSYVWYDSGTYEGLMEASKFVAKNERENKKMIGAIEEIAMTNQWISHAESELLLASIPNGVYLDYLISVRDKIYA